MNPIRYPNFDALRLLLAVEVFILHAHRFYSFAPLPLPFNPVPAFVAISGFLVLQSFERSASWKVFAFKRVRRVMPAFLASLVLVMTLFGASGLWQALSTYGTIGFIGDDKPNGNLWSLSAEEVLYALLAIGAVYGVFKRPALVAVMLLVAVVLPHSNIQPLERLGWLVVCFLAGCLMAIYRERLGKIPSWAWAAAFVVFIVLRFPDANPWFTNHFGLLAQAFVLVGFGAWGPRIQPVTVPDLSYGLYIYHYPLLVAFAGTVAIWPMISGLVALVAASWYLIEKPALAFRGWRSERRVAEPQAA